MSSDNSAPIYLNVGCGDSCQATVDLGKFSGDWETKNIPFSCFDKQGFDRSKLTIRSMFLSPEATTLRFILLRLNLTSLEEVSRAARPNLDRNTETLNKFVMCITASFHLAHHH